MSGIMMAGSGGSVSDAVAVISPGLGKGQSTPSTLAGGYIYLDPDGSLSYGGINTDQSVPGGTQWATYLDAANGYNFFVRATITSGSAFTPTNGTNVAGVWYPLTSRIWFELFNNGTGGSTTTFTLEISLTPDALNIVSTSPGMQVGFNH